MNTIHYSDRRAKKRRLLISLAILIFIIGLYSMSLEAGALSSFITFMLIVTFIVIAWKWKTKAPNVDEQQVAEWASVDDFFETNCPSTDDTDNGIWLGGSFVRTKYANAFVIGGAGIGKTTSRIIPIGLRKPLGSQVYTDIKGEIAFITAAAQAAFGQKVYIFDPLDEQYNLGARHGIKSSGFNPLEFIKRNPEELRDSCDSIAYYLVPDQPNDREPFWRQRSRSLIRTILLHILTYRPKEDHNFYTLYKMLRTTGDEWLKLLIEMKKNMAIDGLVSVAAEEWIGMGEGSATFMGIRSNAQDATILFESPQIRNFFGRDDFNPFDLTNGDCTVYLILPERYINTHYVFFRMIIGLCLQACNARPNAKVFFILDEFPMLKKMDDVQRAFAFGRGQNIHTHIFAQSISGIKEIYGEDGLQGFIANSAVVQVFRGARDPLTRDFFSKLLGNVKRKKRSISDTFTSGANGGSNSYSINEQENSEPLMTPDEIGTGEGIITIADSKKLIIRATPYFKNTFEGVSPDEPWLTEGHRKILRAGKLPCDEQHEEFMKLAHIPPRRG